MFQRANNLLPQGLVSSLRSSRSSSSLPSHSRPKLFEVPCLLRSRVSHPISVHFSGYATKRRPKLPRIDVSPPSEVSPELKSELKGGLNLNTDFLRGILNEVRLNSKSDAYSYLDGPLRSNPALEGKPTFNPYHEVRVITPSSFLESHPEINHFAPVQDEEFETIMANLGADTTRGIVAAVSGGPDSMTMAVLLSRYCSQRDIPLLCVTVDHALRPEAPAEAVVVQDWLSALNIAHIIIRIDWKGSKPTHGVQLKSREARYEALTHVAKALQEKLLNSTGATLDDFFNSPQTFSHPSTDENDTQQHIPDLPGVHVFMAHTADDNIETFWIRNAGSSGSYGLSGIAATRRLGNKICLVRPFLELSKNRLYATLIAEDQPWASDPTNAKLIYQRNHLRTTLEKLSGVPEDPDYISPEEFQSLITNFSQNRYYLDQLTHKFCSDFVVKSHYGFVKLSLSHFLKLADVFALRVLDTLLQYVSGNGSPTRLKPLKEVLKNMIKFANSKASMAPPKLTHCIHGCALVQTRDLVVITRQNLPTLSAVEGKTRKVLPPYRLDTPLKLGTSIYWLESWRISYSKQPKARRDSSAKLIPRVVYVRTIVQGDLRVLKLLAGWPQFAATLPIESILGLPIFVDENSKIIHVPYIKGPLLLEKDLHVQIASESLVEPDIFETVNNLATFKVKFDPLFTYDRPSSSFVGFSQGAASL